MTAFYYNEQVIETKTFKSANLGHVVTFFGCIHGDEVCGIKALEEISEQFNDGSISLKKGTVVLVPCCNPNAFKANKRFTESNLNRVFRKHTDPKNYEERLANELTEIVEKTDVLIDIHSMSASGPANIFIDYPQPESLNLANVIGAPFVILDWPKVYDNNKDKITSYDTSRFAFECNKVSLLLECGQHNDPAAQLVARMAVLNILQYLGMVDIKDNKKMNVTPSTTVRMRELFIKESSGDSFSKNWNHLDTFKKGELLASKADGTSITAPFNGFMILPKNNHPVGTEWFYIGE